MQICAKIDFPADPGRIFPIEPFSLHSPAPDWADVPQLVPASAESFQVWVISDLQPPSAERARQVLRDAVDDMLSLEVSFSAIWCLGDALRGADAELLDLTTSVFLTELKRCGVPVCYLLGNHDMDFRNQKGACHFPLWEAARQDPNWHVQDRLEDFYFLRRFGKCES